MFKLTKTIITILVLLLGTTGASAFEDGQTVRLTIGGKSLMVENSSLDESRNAVLWTETSTNSQRWILQDTGKGTFQMVNAYSDLYLGGVSSVTSGAAIGQIRKTLAASRGSWELVPVEGEEGLYYIYMGTARRFVLTCEADVTEGSKVTLMSATVAPQERIKWGVEVVDPMPREFTEDMRDDMMNKWKAKYYKKASSGYVIGNGGWWGDAEMFEVVLDAYETTGDPTYATMFDNLYTNFISRNKNTWYQQGVSGYNEYNDDIAWMCIACVRGYLLTGQTKYLNTARTNFNGMFKRADCYGNDLLQWKCSNTSTGTNACINGPASVCACYLAIATADMSYYEKARKTYAANRNFLYEFKNGKFTGKVYDSGNFVDNTFNYWSSTYNQGTCLGAAIMLYEHFGDEMYKEDADAIMRWTKSNLANSNGLVHVCQTVSGDLCGFKGILMRYVRRYAAVLGHPEYYDWLKKNAYHAWNNRNSSGITSSAWLTKAEEDFKHQEGSDLKTFGSEGCFTAVSAAFNAHLGAVDERNAYGKMEAEDFNFIRNTPKVIEGTDEDGTGMVGPMKNNYYMGYRNVDFGTRAASHVNLRAYLYRNTSKVNVYLDGPNAKSGTLLCTVTADDADGITSWQTYRKALNIPVTGKHNIYFVASGTAGVNIASLNWFEFDSVNDIYGDNTNNMGTLTTSLSCEPSGLASLTDDDITTGITGTMAGTGTAWIQYRSTAPVLPQGYSLYSGLEENDPISWKLLASADGSEWTTLHEQPDTVISVRGQCFRADIDVRESYSYFRLEFVLPEGQNALSLAEWQILGRGIAQTDITADGGTITEGMEALADHEGNTSVAAPLTASYKSNGNYLLHSYSITAGEGNAPSSWVLEGSNNGTSWKTIDTRSGYTFPYPGSTSVFLVNAPASYIHYRLNVTSEESFLTQWQLFGNLDYGTFYPDVASSICKVSACDGSDVAALTDKNGSTYATIQGDDLYWVFESPIPVKVTGFSALCGDNPDFDPKDIVVTGMDTTGATVEISARTLSFSARGTRVQYTLSSSKLFNRLEFHVKNTASGNIGKACLAELELYGTAIAAEGAECLPEVLLLEASSEGATASEQVSRLNDNNRLTRYRADFKDQVSITYTYSSQEKIDTYALTASKDNATCDPSSWILEGSNDGEQWTVLDERDSQTFSHRYATQFYRLEQEADYSQYRLTVTALNGGAQIQLAELQYLLLEDNQTAIHPLKTGNVLPTITVADGAAKVNTPEPTLLRVYDVSGRLVQTNRLQPGTTVVPLPETNGMYILSCSVGGVNVTRKVVR